ncbi:MAG: threonine/serine dehydratase [Bacteroidota bacterium]
MTKAIAPDLQTVKKAIKFLENLTVRTPVHKWEGQVKDRLLGKETEVYIKMELLQHGGSFKTRGALINMADLSEEELKRGVTAVSAGNHAIATSFAASLMNSHAKVVMPDNANPSRIKKCEELGAEVVLVPDVTEAFRMVEEIQEKEGRKFIHPFEGPLTATGTATLGYEFQTQVPRLDACVIPIGGGGLAAGMSTGLKLANPNIEIFGVEPIGADTMHRSFHSGKPEKLDKVRTIADSLGAPFSLPYSMSLCMQNLEQVVLVNDEMLKSSMELIFRELKQVVEPAGAASMAAVLEILKNHLSGKRVGVLICGSNIDLETFYKSLKNAKVW